MNIERSMGTSIIEAYSRSSENCDPLHISIREQKPVLTVIDPNRIYNIVVAEEYRKKYSPVVPEINPDMSTPQTSVSEGSPNKEMDGGMKPGIIDVNRIVKKVRAKIRLVRLASTILFS